MSISQRFFAKFFLDFGLQPKSHMIQNFRNETYFIQMLWQLWKLRCMIFSSLPLKEEAKFFNPGHTGLN